MGDSDDDVDYKRRDKFRTERRGYDSINEDGGRREWRDPRPGPPGGGWGSRSERRYEGGYRRDRYDDRRHEMSPPSKRVRGGDWDDRYDRGYHDYNDRYDYDRGYKGGRGGGYYRSGQNGAGHSINSSSERGEQGDGGQPVMMSFKSFLTTQDDSISDDDAIKKYAEYKLEFRRQQLNEFFVSHKDEEWFKLKYHPEDSSKRREEQKSALNKRADVFTNFLKQGKFDAVNVDSDQSDQIIKLLDSVVILLEGGSDFDLEVLEKVAEEEGDKNDGEDSKPFVLEKDEEAGGVKKDENLGATESTQPISLLISEEQLELQKKAKEYLQSNNGTSAEGNEGEKRKRKRKRTKEFDDDDDESSDRSSSDEGEEEGPPGLDKVRDANEGVEDACDPSKKVQIDSGAQNDSSDNAAKDNADGAKAEVSDDKKEKEDVVEDRKEGVTEGPSAPGPASSDAAVNIPKPRPLHKVTSIFLRNLSPTITKQEVEAMCRRYPGFLRAAIADPQPERRWFRRGWVTFERDVKIKEICYSLNNIRLRECELGPIVNRDLSRRVRTVNGITVDKKVVRNDIKLAAKVITNLDKRWKLWEKQPPGGPLDESEAKDEVMESPSEEINTKEEVGMGLTSNNPLLSNITDYLIEEASAEEEELLGKNNDLEDGEEGEDGNKVVRDADLIKVLDRLLFYLRIVHSVDYYNHSEYPNEDEMPNRCGIIHARGIPPVSNVTQAEIDDYCTSFGKKMGSFLQPRWDLSNEEAVKLGLKNEEDEVEKFVQANTQELGKDKWLCPLSGKKFKGPDFVRKHIFNKHSEKVEEVKKEVKYYNNYLKDPKRPQNPDSTQKTSSGLSAHRGDMGHGDPYHYRGYPREATNYPVFDDPKDKGHLDARQGGLGGGYRGRGRPEHGLRGRGVRDRIGGPLHHPPSSGVRYNDSYGGRPVITYRDLDAPRETDEY